MTNMLVMLMLVTMGMVYPAIDMMRQYDSGDDRVDVDGDCNYDDCADDDDHG